MADDERSLIVWRTNEDWTGSTVFEQVNEAEAIVPIDLTGYVFDMEVRATPESNSVLLSLNNKPGGNGRIIVATPATGLMAMFIENADVKLRPGAYVFDLRMTKAGVTQTISVGDVVVPLGVTRDH